MKRSDSGTRRLLASAGLVATIVAAVALTLMPDAGATALRSNVSPKKGLVAFVGTATGVPQLYAAKVDGSELRQLTFDSGGISDASPQWSSDGKRLLVIAAPDVIASMRADGSDRVDIRGISPAFSPNGKWLAYYVCAPGGVCDLAVAQSDGGQAVVVGAGVSFSGRPGWSSDSQKLAYVRNGSIWQSDRRGRDTNMVATPQFGYVDTPTPVYFPDDHTISFIGMVSLPMSLGLFSVPADGSGTPVLRQRGPETMSLNVSPTRSRIAVTRTSVSVGTSMAAYDSTFAFAFGPQTRTVATLVWSPDGSKLGYSYCARISTATNPLGYPGSPCTLQFSDASGTTVFYNGPSVEGVQPWVAGFDWSPDSASLVLSVSVAGGPFRLMTVKADGSGLNSIFPSGSDNQTHPAWQPENH